MAVTRRVLRRAFGGLLSVLLACMASLVVPAVYAVAEPTPSPSAIVEATADVTPPDPLASESPSPGPSSAEPSSPAPSTTEPSSTEPTSTEPSSPEPTGGDTWTPTPTGPPVGAPTMAATPGFTLTLSSDQPDGALVWADDEIGYELIGTNTGADRLDSVTISDDLTGVLHAAAVEAEPQATVLHADGSTESEPVILTGDLLTWTGRIEAGASVRIGYVVTVGLVEKATTLRNVATASWILADGTTEVTRTAEASNPVNPVAIAAGHDSAHGGSTKTLANTGFSDGLGLLAYAGLSLLFGIALLAVRRRD